MGGFSDIETNPAETRSVKADQNGGFRLEKVSLFKGWMPFHRIWNTCDPRYEQPMRLWGLSRWLSEVPVLGKFFQNYRDDYDARYEMCKISAPEEKACSLLLRHEDEPVGTVTVETQADRPGSGAMRISNVATDAKFRGQGLGQVLLDLTAVFAKKNGFFSVCVYAEENPKVVEAYERAGFVRKEWDYFSQNEGGVQMVRDLYSPEWD
ncbi:MAG: GNAT family N-acetyltransferase [Alphaproteobacteria bacterium]|nr:GNAT family N-acetyltransferase [Alphaproteobacteria bacterium]